METKEIKKGKTVSWIEDGTLGVIVDVKVNPFMRENIPETIIIKWADAENKIDTPIDVFLNNIELVEA